MPQAKPKSSAGLSIELSGDHRFYTPGSKVSGDVVLNTAQDFAIGSVNVEFYGRVKVFMVYSHGHGESQYRGRAPLFSYKQVLYQGYHTHKPGNFRWPFLFELPKSPNVATLHEAKHQWNEKQHFISTDDYTPNHPIPPTFEMWKYGFGFRWHAFTEYVLRVDVKEAEGASMVLPAASRKAVLPIRVRDVATPDSNTLSLPLLDVNFRIPEPSDEESQRMETNHDNPKMQVYTSRHTVRSSILQSWDRNQKGFNRPLSFSNSVRDKTKSFFNSNSLSRYTFDFKISLPESVQLLREGAFPIFVDAVPVQDEEHTTIPPDNYPDVHVENITVELIAHTYIRFKTILPANVKTKYDIKLLTRQPVNYMIDVVATGKNSVEDGEGTKVRSKAFDLSSLPGLSPTLISAKLGVQTEKPLCQTFNTYIIAREYSLNYKVELDVAGEKVKVSNDDKIPVRVLPPESEDLTAFLHDVDVVKTACDVEGEHAEDSESEAAEIDDVKKGGMLKKIRSRKSQSKAEEAAEEAAANDDTRHVTEQGVHPLSFQTGETLPIYQANPSDFGYRNEIDERPPRYDAD